MIKGWKKSTLGEACHIEKGKASAANEPAGIYPLITTGEGRKSAATWQFEGPAVCVPMISAFGHGKPGLNRVHYQEGKFALANILSALLVKNPKELSAKFLHVFLSFYKDQLIVPLQFGAANMSITVERLATVPIWFPSLQEQERILGLIDEAESLQATRARANARMKQFVPALFQEMFGNEKWNKAKVIDITEKRSGAIRTGPFGSQLRHSEFVSEGVPVIGIENIVTNSFQWTRARCIATEKYEKFKRYRIFPKDVIVTIMGTVGRVCVAPDDLPKCMSTKHICVISTDKDIVDPYFLWASFLFDQDVRRQTSLVTKGAIMEGWNATIIKQLSISTPPICIQREFAARVGEARGVQSAQGKSSEKIEALYQSMLSRAFAGEL